MTDTLLLINPNLPVDICKITTIRFSIIMPEPIKAAYLVSLKIDMTNKSGITYVNTKGFVEVNNIKV